MIYIYIFLFRFNVNTCLVSVLLFANIENICGSFDFVENMFYSVLYVDLFLTKLPEK